MLVTNSQIANREDPDQTVSSGLGLHCLSWPYNLADNLRMKF